MGERFLETHAREDTKVISITGIKVTQTEVSGDATSHPQTSWNQRPAPCVARVGHPGTSPNDYQEDRSEPTCSGQLRPVTWQPNAQE